MCDPSVKPLCLNVLFECVQVLLVTVEGCDQTTFVFRAQTVVVIDIFTVQFGHLTSEVVQQSVSAADVPFFNQSSVHVCAWGSFFVVVTRVSEKFFDLVSSSSGANSVAVEVLLDDFGGVSCVGSGNDDAEIVKKIGLGSDFEVGVKTVSSLKGGKKG